jgi:PAS domain S-box-containing protein
MSIPAPESIDARWQREGIERCRRGLYAFGALVFALVAISAGYSWIFEPALFYELARVRFVMAAGVTGVLLYARTPRGRLQPRPLALLMMFIIAAGTSMLAHETGGLTSPQQQRVLFTIYGAALLLTWNGWWSLAGCVVVFAVVIFASAASGELANEHLPGVIGRLLAAATVCVAVNIARERYRWRELCHTQDLSEANRRADLKIRQHNEQLEKRILARTAELHASERHARAMFDAAPIGVITLTASGEVSEANLAFATMTGLDKKALQGSSILDLTSAQDRDATRDAYDALVAGSRSTFSMDKAYIGADGEEVFAHEVVAAIRDESGAFDYALAMIEDVTEHVHAKERAREHESQLAHVLRVSALDEMASELAHEINQPLGAIVNFANGTATRLRNSGGDPELVESVTRISDEAWRAAEILRRMHRFVEPDETSREDTDLNVLVNDVAILVAGDARRCQTPLQLHCDPSLPAVSVDPMQIEQVILNLVRNALDAIRNNSSDSHELVIETKVDNGCVALWVRDTGPGVTEEERAHMTDAFYTTKPGALGMGLSISRTIVEAHDGRLRIEDNPGRGIAVGFTLPFSNSSSASA